MATSPVGSTAKQKVGKDNGTASKKCSLASEGGGTVAVLLTMILLV